MIVVIFTAAVALVSVGAVAWLRRGGDSRVLGIVVLWLLGLGRLADWWLGNRLADWWLADRFAASRLRGGGGLLRLRLWELQESGEFLSSRVIIALLFGVGSLWHFDRLLCLDDDLWLLDEFLG